MAISYYLDIARSGLCMPMATDLVLNEDPDPEATRRDGFRLGQVVERTARRWGSTLALPLMDLRLDKADLLSRLGIGEAEADRFHFSAAMDQETREAIRRGEAPGCSGSTARDGALRYIANSTDLLPVGMTIGPFSLATKLMADPITAAALLGSGVSAEADSQVKLLCDCLEAALSVVLSSVRRQLEQGARAMLVCEPAASMAFLSPRQIKGGSPIFERLVLEPNSRLSRVLRDAAADLIFHNCGELTPRDDPGVRHPARAGGPEPGQLAKTLGRRRAGSGFGRALRQPALQIVLLGRRHARGGSSPSLRGAGAGHARSRPPPHPGHRMRRASRSGSE